MAGGAYGKIEFDPRDAVVRETEMPINKIGPVKKRLNFMWA